MDERIPFNLIIAGVGGQGVYSLTRIIWDLCRQYGIKNQGSVFKGGAQTLGSIHAQLRLFLKKNPNYAYYSAEIPQGELDLMIGLEPWETLRYHSYFGRRTKVVINEKITPLFIERYRPLEMSDPTGKVKELAAQVTAKNYTLAALETFDSIKMVNFLIGWDALSTPQLPFTPTDYTKAFMRQVSLKPEVERSLRVNYL